MTERERILALSNKEMSIKICKRSAEIDVLSVPALCRKLLNSIGGIAFDFEKVGFPFAFKISKATGTNFVLDPTTLADFLTGNCSLSNNLIEIDYQGNLIAVHNESFLDYTHAVEHSEQGKSLMFFISGRQIHAIVCGICVDYVPNASVYKPSTAVNGTELHIDEWVKILSRYETEIKGQKRFFYWAPPKDKGLLMDSPEKLFRKDFAKFIEENTIGCWVDEEAYNDSTENRVDVRTITQLDQNVYYFELKCLGTCVGGTPYKEDHAIEGLHQINTYVVNDPKSVVGVLVVFDARNGDSDIKWPEKIIKALDPRVSRPPRHVKLDPTSASNAAKKAVKKVLRSN